MADLRIGFTSHSLKIITASICDFGTLWSCDREAASWCVFAGTCVCAALTEKETLAGSVRLKSGKQELVAANVGLALLLTIDLVLQVKESSDNV